jgi:hypothetical protein
LASDTNSNKVYLLLEYVAHEGCTVLGVYAERVDAEEEATRKHKRLPEGADDYQWYQVETWKVQE